MNQQFRLLAEQVEWRFADQLTGEFSEYDKRLIKFAELIVRECNEHLLNDAKLTDIQTTRCVASIKKHFGVEE